MYPVDRVRWDFIERFQEPFIEIGAFIPVFLAKHL